MAKLPRSVIREHHFEKDLAELICDFADADDFVAGAEWLLAQNPEIGFRTAPDSAVWFLPMTPIEGTQVAVYYTFDDLTLWLISLART